MQANGSYLGGGRPGDPPGSPEVRLHHELVWVEYGEQKEKENWGAGGCGEAGGSSFEGFVSPAKRTGSEVQWETDRGLTADNKWPCKNLQVSGRFRNTKMALALPSGTRGLQRAEE